MFFTFTSDHFNAYLYVCMITVDSEVCSSSALKPGLTGLLYLPKCVELLPVRNGEFASPVFINAIVHDLVIMQETQRKGDVSAIVFSLSNSVRRKESDRGQRTIHSHLQRLLQTDP